MVPLGFIFLQSLIIHIHGELQVVCGLGSGTPSGVLHLPEVLQLGLEDCGGHVARSENWADFAGRLRCLQRQKQDRRKNTLNKSNQF